MIQTGQLTPVPLRSAAATDPSIVALTGRGAVEGVSYFVFSPPALVAAGAGVAAGALSATPHTQLLLALRQAPLALDMYGNGAPGAPLLTINGGGFTYLEHRRKKEGGGSAAARAAAPERRVLHWDEAGKAVYEDSPEGGEPDAASLAAAAAVAPATGTDDGQWEESFGSHHDSKPLGPQSVGFDVSFPTASHIFGIPEHASSHSLHATDGSEGEAYRAPYRLYNLDVFEYELDNPMALYGSIPFLVSTGLNGVSAGVFWNNPTETYIDVKRTAGAAPAGSTQELTGVSTRWVSEAGVFDLHLLPGPGGKAVTAQFTNLVGATALPPLFALGYHQCRWNYKDEADVFAVDAKFEELAFPYDVLWLDIEHTDGKRYFTWDAALFPNPAAMQDKLAARGHKMVTIIDPHIKKDANYWVHSEAVSKGLYVRKADGGEYEGWCWPGSSGYLDFTSSAVRDWWADQFAFHKYKGSTPALYTWNDMNEPSVFNGPEVSMHKDAKSLAGIEHREWHNLYGFYQTMATAEGQLRRGGADRGSRPFVLSRAFSAGTQRHAAIWTGDNFANWESLRQAAPMLLTVGVSGLTFVGADVGGFFQNPAPELLVRWYEAGSFQPFFRAHAHIDTARREPWLFGETVMTQLRDIVRTRYTYLPLWYTLFAAANATGVPAMRPMWMEYPGESPARWLDDQWLVGDALLVKPVVEPGVELLKVYFPGKDHWYRADTLALERRWVSGTAGGVSNVAAPLGRLPVFQRGGTIVPRQMRPRRSSAAQLGDPYTLVVALDGAGRAAGHLYLDDGATHDFIKRSAFRLREFRYEGGSSARHTLRSVTAAGGKAWAPENAVERVLVAGLQRAPLSVSAGNGTAGDISFFYDSELDVLTIRKPGVKAAYDWELTLAF